MTNRTKGYLRVGVAWALLCATVSLIIYGAPISNSWGPGWTAVFFPIQLSALVLAAGLLAIGILSLEDL